jgi:hypothetical protein
MADLLSRAQRYGESMDARKLDPGSTVVNARRVAKHLATIYGMAIASCDATDPSSLNFAARVW